VKITLFNSKHQIIIDVIFLTVSLGIFLGTQGERFDMNLISMIILISTLVFVRIIFLLKAKVSFDEKFFKLKYSFISIKIRKEEILEIKRDIPLSISKGKGIGLRYSANNWHLIPAKVLLEIEIVSNNQSVFLFFMNENEVEEFNKTLNASPLPDAV